MDSTAENEWERSPDDDEYTERRSTSMMVGGIILTAGGGLFGLTGLMFVAVGDTTSCSESYDGDRTCYGQDYTGIGTGLLILGGVGMAVGVPLLLHGAGRVPVHQSAHNQASAGDTALLLGIGSAGVEVLW
jgi:hypothetical protein